MKKLITILFAALLATACGGGGEGAAYRPVVFKDMSNGDCFLSQSTCNTKETIEFEGETYPLVKLEISNTSHPFYTGKAKLVDTAGRVDKFMSRYSKTLKK